MDLGTISTNNEEKKLAKNLNLDFRTVTRELISLVGRRRELMLFLGSLFAGMAIYLQNVLEGKLPPALKPMEQSAFRTYALAMLIPTIIIALRIARLHGGIVINGIFHATIMKQLRPTSDPKRSARLNWFGVSTQLFLLADLIAGFGAALLTITIRHEVFLAVMAGLGTFALLLLYFMVAHVRAANFALRVSAQASVEKVEQQEVENHAAASLETANQDMLGILAFVGLILFTVFQSLSGLGAIGASTDLSRNEIQQTGPMIYSLLVLATTWMGMVVYIRLAIAVGQRSLELDPTDQPFKVFKLTDSLLGYSLLACFFAASVHLLVFTLWQGGIPNILLVDLGAFLVGLLAYPVTMFYCARQTAAQ